MMDAPLRQQDVFADRVMSEEDLRALLGWPGELVRRKVLPALDEHCRAFIARSPFLLISSADATGACDVSPRGDAPGFVLALDETRLVIPERPGNRRMDTPRNILQNPRIGLLFAIPGMGETLRVNGRACVFHDPEVLARLATRGKTPLVAIGVEVEECYLHCAKAFKRSRLWEPTSWPAPESLPSAACMLADQAALPGMTAADVERQLEDSYANRLY
jgi:PPOX class probable FMN-dependent enzyme